MYQVIIGLSIILNVLFVVGTRLRVITFYLISLYVNKYHYLFYLFINKIQPFNVVNLIIELIQYPYLISVVTTMVIVTYSSTIVVSLILQSLYMHVHLRMTRDLHACYTACPISKQLYIVKMFN